VTVLLVKRGEETIYNPDADTKLMPGDWVFALGEPARLSMASALFGRPA